jgi:hypothetical protein
MKTIINTNNTKKETLQSNLETRNKELMYMSQYMSMIINEKQLAVLKMTG